MTAWQEVLREALNRGASLHLSGGMVRVVAPDGALGSGLVRALKEHREEILAAMTDGSEEAGRLAKEHAEELRTHLGPGGKGWCWLYSPTYRRSFAFLNPEWSPTEKETAILRGMGFFGESGRVAPGGNCQLFG